MVIGRYEIQAETVHDLAGFSFAKIAKLLTKQKSYLQGGNIALQTGISLYYSPKIIVIRDSVPISQSLFIITLKYIAGEGYGFSLTILGSLVFTRLLFVL